jgi:hypothetical protein
MLKNAITGIVAAGLIVSGAAPAFAGVQRPTYASFNSQSVANPAAQDFAAPARSRVAKRNDLAALGISPIIAAFAVAAVIAAIATAATTGGNSSPQ